jgi:parvulin-like peptidyl-prolyl isomerase
MRPPLFITLFILAPIVVGCQSDPRGGPANAAPPDAAARDRDNKPAAYIDGVAVSRDDLYQQLVEAQGGQILSELLLDRAVTRKLKEQRVALTDADLDAERERLLANLSADRDQATRLLNTMREQRGLGERRFASLLRRNAGLRKLVADNIVVADAAVEQAYALRFGPRYRVRLITANDVDTLNKARRRVLAGQPFTDLAVELSTDASAAQGGLLSPISTLDATYPKAIRDALPELSTQDRAARLSPAIALPEGYALLWLEGVINPQAPPIESVRAQIERSVRLELERVRMQQLARVLIGQANVVVLDPALDAAWRRQREAIEGQ